MKTNFHSNGKLLLTGEYLVLDGAKALAIPTKLGQSLNVCETKKRQLSWKSVNERGEVWFEDSFLILENRKIRKTTENIIGTRLEKILCEAHQLNPRLFSEKKGFEITSTLDFPQNWGLGSSSTLINNIAEWFEIDAYELLDKTFGGSGYDIACAKTDQPISYQLRVGKRNVSQENFNPNFKDVLFFVHLNRKQNSREAIAHYKQQSKNQLSEAVKTISFLTQAVIDCCEITSFEKLLTEHEEVISSMIHIPPIKTQLFKDYPNAIKSLGGWGGDFILAVGGETEKEYFRKKGFGTVVDYEEMV